MKHMGSLPRQQRSGNDATADSELAVKRFGISRCIAWKRLGGERGPERRFDSGEKRLRV